MKACGIRIARSHRSASWFFGQSTGLDVRDFEIAAYAWVGEEEPLGRSLYACDQIPLPSNGWSGQNYMGWCNRSASDAIELAADTARPQAERKAHYAQVIEALAYDMPMLPLFMRHPADPASYTWEHLDFNLQTFGATAAVADPAIATTMGFLDHDGNEVRMWAFENTFTESTQVAFTPLVEGEEPPAGPPAFRAFRLALAVDGAPVGPEVLQRPLEVHLPYTDEQVATAGLKEGALRLYLWTAEGWADATASCPEAQRRNEVDAEANRVTVAICEVGEFTLRAGVANQLYLPLIRL
jgi:hypothetical protein